MKKLYTFILFISIHFFARSQSINVSGQCMTGTIILTKIADESGKAAYAGTGTVLGQANTPVVIQWLVPDNIWVLMFDGQPYYYSPCNSALPPKTNNGNPSCEWVADGACAGAAALNINGTGVLPVRLVSFGATSSAGKVILDWKTSSELNNKGFDILRSKDGLSFSKIGFVKGSGESAIEKYYSFKDEAPFPGKNYYRLAQLDLDEKQTLSDIAVADLSGINYKLKNNTSKTGLYELVIASGDAIEFAVTDFNGKKLLTGQATRGTNKIDLGKYPAGIYLLQVKKQNKIVTEKLIRN